MRKEVDSLLLGCFTLQKLYGREPEAYEIINRMFHEILAGYRGDLIVLSLKAWLTKSPEFPTPADIIDGVKQEEQREQNELRNVSVTLDTLRRYKQMGIPLMPWQEERLAEAGSEVVGSTA